MVRKQMFVSLILVGCGGFSQPKLGLIKQDLAARERCIPVSPVPEDKVTFTDATGSSKTEFWSQLAEKDIVQYGLLPNEEALSSTTQLSGSGEVSFASAGISADAGEYTSTLDYSVFRIEPLAASSGKSLGQSHVGVSIRVKADVVTMTSNVNLGSLMAIGAAAQAAAARGKMQVYVIGIDSPDVIQLFPTPTTIDETSIQKTLEAVASIKAKIGDTATVLRPHVLEICLNNDPQSTVAAAKSALMAR